MNPNYNMIITVYHEENKSWTREVLRDCFFKAVTGTVASGNTLNSQNAYVVRIPAQAKPLYIASGDIIIKGEITEEITGKSPFTATEFLRKYSPDAFRVTSVSDNTNFPVGKHYRAGG